MKMGSEVYHNLKKVIKDKYGQDACNVGDEGGFAPNILDNTEVHRRERPDRTWPPTNPARSVMPCSRHCFWWCWCCDATRRCQRHTALLSRLCIDAASERPRLTRTDLWHCAQGLDLLVTAIEAAGYTGKVKIGMDVAASEFWLDAEKVYDLDFKTANNDGSQKMSGEKLQELYASFVEKYPMVSIEDPYDQDDFASYKSMTAAHGETCQIVGDDLLVTNPTRVQKAIDEKACNALLLKVNQIGSITESIEAVKMAKNAGWGVMTSHRSGETEDSFIADLAVGLKTGQIKTGAPCRSERLSKYNQLLRIEEELGSGAVYAGDKFRTP